MRRYVTDAGPLLGRLHRLTRSDCTTRNLRKAARLSHAYDDLEARIEVLLEQEEPAGGAARARRAADHAACSGCAPARSSAGRTSTCCSLRLDEGPVGPERATEVLLAWWAEQPEARA
ncbi:hypothetical protein GCM10025868_23410 [Angustibacter aerolatus]|uniref:Uncharacterized protein n=1 Tax=Angustibacter aerolatus TaxID=1162965 RepID=A0ABQ6JHU2_9ACTN|nr:hypothetical protein GCM10025868_23410 [Angustibacter aerolatus]